MAFITIDDAAVLLSDLVARAEAGEEIIFVRGERQVATLRSMALTRRVFGAFKDTVEVPPDSFFFDPLPDEALEAWRGGSEDPSR